MQISKEELQKIIKEEVNEIFGFGKKEPTKEYPASELATIIKGLDDASKRSGAELTPSQREAIVDELTGVLEDEGFVVKENERLFTGEEDVVVTHQNAPKLKVFLDTIAQKSPKVFKQLLGLFNRSALDISPVVKSIADNIPSILTVADPEPDEDQTDTIVTEPVAAPDEEDQTDTIVAEPVRGPDPDQEDQTDTIVTEPVAAPDLEDEEEDIPSILTVADPEEEAVDFGEFFLSLDDETLEEFFSSVEPNDFKWGTIRIDIETFNQLLDKRADIFGLSPKDAYEAREELLDDQNAAARGPDEYGIHPNEVARLAQKAQQKMIALAKDILAKEDSKWDAALDKVQAGLDVLGAVGLWPPAMAVSKPATIASLILNTSRGMYGWALFDLVSLTPIVGEAMKAGKLGKGAKGAVAAARAKKFGTLRKLVKAGHAGKARTASKYLKNARAATVLEQGAAGIVELIPDDLLKKLINEKTDEGEPMIPWMIAQLGKVPGLGNKVENLQRAWQEVVSAAKAEKMNPALAEHKELDRMKVLAGIK